MSTGVTDETTASRMIHHNTISSRAFQNELTLGIATVVLVPALVNNHSFNGADGGDLQTRGHITSTVLFLFIIFVANSFFLV